MKKFKTGGSRNSEDRGSKFGGGPRKQFGGKGGFGGNRGGFGGERTMFRATCAECGKPCEVPFKPTGEKPVFCSTCFSNRSEGGQRPAFENRPSQSAPDFRRLEDKLDAITLKIDSLLDLMAKTPVKAVVKEKKAEVAEKKPKAVKKEISVEKNAKKAVRKAVKK